jgi:hypothetical protein
MRRTAFAVALVLTVAVAAAEPHGGATAQVHCERRSSSGRVVCEVESEVKQGRIVYADAIVIEAPEKARPLRSRVGLSEAIAVTPQRVRLPLGFFAEDLGSGTIRVRSRLVVCLATGPRSETCLPRTVEARAELVVGPLAEGDTS